MKARAGDQRIRLTLDLLVLAIFCGICFFFGLDAAGLIGADEPRYAQIAREMLARHDWVVPTLYGQPWLEKPVLYYWEAMLAYRAFGVSDWAARLPAAVNASALVFGAYFFARRSWRQFGFDAALIVATAAFWIGFGHAASTDMPLAATFGLGMFAWLEWLSARAHIENGGVSRSRTAYPWLAAFYVFMGLATLAKGPVAPLLAALIVAAFALLRRDRHVILESLWPPGIVLYLAVTLPWYVRVQQRTGTFFQVFILEHNLERFGTETFHHLQPFWYLAAVMLLALLPWTLLALFGLVDAIRECLAGLHKPQDTRGLRQTDTGTDTKLVLLLWAVVPVVFFSVPATKLPGYILPAVPAFALLSANYLRARLARRSIVGWPLTILHAFIVGAMFSAALLTPSLLTARFRARVPGLALSLAALAGLIVAVVVALAIRRVGLRILRLATIVPVILALIFLLQKAAPAANSLFSARPVAQQLAQLAPPNAPVAGYNSRRELDYGLAFYRNSPVYHYTSAEGPAYAHILIIPFENINDLLPHLQNRAPRALGSFPDQGLQFYWVAAK